jgi:hypothetical protein
MELPYQVVGSVKLDGFGTDDLPIFEYPLSPCVTSNVLGVKRGLEILIFANVFLESLVGTFSFPLSSSIPFFYTY